MRRRVQILFAGGACVFMMILTTSVLTLPGLIIQPNAPPKSTPSPSHIPSAQERIHAPRPMTAEEMQRVRLDNKVDHTRTFRVPSASVRPRTGDAENDTMMLPDGMCMHTVHSTHLYTDSVGRVCVRPDDNGCCTDGVRPACDGCIGDERRCCVQFEHCVACCMGALDRGSAGYVPCKEACRTNSASLLHPGDREYKDTRPHCFEAAQMRMFGNVRNILSHYLEWVGTPLPTVDKQQPPPLAEEQRQQSRAEEQRQQQAATGGGKLIQIKL
jgi:hypothetical protein